MILYFCHVAINYAAGFNVKIQRLWWKRTPAPTPVSAVKQNQTKNLLINQHWDDFWWKRTCVAGLSANICSWRCCEAYSQSTNRKSETCDCVSLIFTHQKRGNDLLLGLVLVLLVFSPELTVTFRLPHWLVDGKFLGRQDSSGTWCSNFTV